MRMRYIFKIFGNEFVTKVPVVEDAEDGNGGLPEWFFDGDFYELGIDEETGQVEWIPPVGPAPCCFKKTFPRPLVLSIITTEFRRWERATY